MDTVVVLHVADRIHEDEEADDGDDEKHHRRQRVNERRDVDVEVPDADPFVERHRRSLVAAQDLEENADRDQRGKADRHRGDDPRPAVQPASTEDAVDQERRERERGEPQDVLDHPLSCLISSTSTVGRLRYAERTIARPTATSAAATTKMKTTKTLPRSSIEA